MKSILIAMTTDEQASSLAGLLEQRGYFVVKAGDADLAVAFLRHDMPIDAVVMDQAVEGFWTIMGEVRRRGPVPPPAIILSDRVAVEDYLSALSAGAFDLFFRPIRQAEFLRVLDAALSQNAGRTGSGTSPAVPFVKQASRMLEQNPG